MLYIGKERILNSADNSGMKWNLLDGTADFKNAIHPFDYPIETDIKSPYGNKCYHGEKAWNYMAIPVNLVKDHVYCFSLSIKFADTAHYDMRGYDGDGIEFIKPHLFTDLSKVPVNKWLRPYAVFKAVKTTTYNMAISPSDAITADYGDYMLVEGDTPAEWNYSLKDFRNLVGGVNSSLIYSYTPEMEVA